MNIAQLFHNQTNIQTIPHWPVFVINSSNKKTWYFYSAKGYTLRKKIQNTSIVAFLNINNKIENNQQNLQQRVQNNRDMILELREVDNRQPKQGQIYQIKTNKLNISEIISSRMQQHSILTKNDWYVHQNSQVSLYRINDPLRNQLHTLLWSSNIITCKAPITTHLRQKLTNYTQIIYQKIIQKVLKGKLKIKQFQLVFTYNQAQGKVKVLFAHNFKLIANLNSENNFNEMKENQMLKIKEMYMTNFKVGRDEHECIQLIQQQQKQKFKNEPNKQKIIIDQQLKQLLSFPAQPNPLPFNQVQQKNRLYLLKTLKKLHPPQSAQIRNINIAIKKQIPPTLNKQFQCSACFSYVVCQQFQHQNMVTNNRIRQIQILRQIKMKKNGGSSAGYDLVPVCGLCYSKFKQIVEGRQVQVKKIKCRSLTKQKSQRQQRNKTNQITIRSQSVKKNKKLISKIGAQCIKFQPQYTTKTNTTINQQNKIEKTNGPNKMRYFLNTKTQRNRKHSFQQETSLQKQYSNVKILMQKACKSSNARIKQTYQSFNQNIKKQENKTHDNTNKQIQFDKQTDDQLQNALEQYAGFGWQANRNKRIARFINNKKIKLQKGKNQL